ncbi:MAG TPA: hypothetical protein VGD78_03390 [Chthoniobacterales bacterium]
MRTRSATEPTPILRITRPRWVLTVTSRVPRRGLCLQFIGAIRDVTFRRKKQIPMLAKYFIQRYSAKMGRKMSRISRKALELFQSYASHGNTRESFEPKPNVSEALVIEANLSEVHLS